MYKKRRIGGMDAILPEYWKGIVESIYSDVLIADRNGKIVYANKKSEFWFGVNLEDLIGVSVYELEKRRIFYPSVTRMVLETNQKQKIIQTTKTGKKLLLNGDILYNQQNEIQYVITYSQDITDFEKLKTYVNKVELELKTVQNELSILQKSQNLSSKIVAASTKMKQILTTSTMVAEADTSILITGETGVGKNVLAHFIHERSGRKGPLIEVNCGALPESLLESELFGYVPGSFTGANAKGKKGLVEEAKDGTLFLDEIGELSFHLQVKLLTLIQEKKYFKIGESKPRFANFRLVAATHVNLEKKVAEKQFREDLFYRLSVIPLNIPPLREREEDLSELILIFIEKYNHLHQKRKEFNQQTVDLLIKYSWPGNVRELSNVIERLILTVEPTIIMPSHLPEKILAEGITNPLNKIGKNTLTELLTEVEINILKKAKNECKSTTEMAKLLGVSQPTIVRKLQKYRQHFPS